MVGNSEAMLEVLVNAVVSIGRRNTQLEPVLHSKQELRALARLDQQERCPGWVLAQLGQTVGSARGSTAESMHWIVLHRPVELAALIGEWPTTQHAPPLTLSAPLCYVEAFLIEERKPPVPKP